MPDDATKRCTRCGHAKPREQFSRRSDSSDGLGHWCRGCASEYARARYVANKDEIKSRMKAYYYDNRDAALERVSQRYRSNPEPVKDYVRRYQAEELKALRKAVFGHYGNSCACCGTDQNLSIDHIDGKGGEHRRELFGNPGKAGGRFYAWLVRQNFPPGYQTLCRSCNNSKARGPRCRLTH